MNSRKSVAMFSAQEKQAFIQAVLDLKNPARSPSRIPAAAAFVTSSGGTPNRYDDYVWIHNQVGGGAHRGPAFGPWHREFLRQFEYDLQHISGNVHLTIPYWDWTVDQTPASAGWPFTDDFMGGFGDPTTGRISTGPFADPTTFRVSIRRAGDHDPFIKRSRGLPDPSFLPTRADVLAAFGSGLPAGESWPRNYDAAPFNTNPPNDQAQLTAQVQASFRKYLEYLLHDGIHVWVGDIWDFVGGNPQNGGQMSFPAVSVNDPVFWLHHCNVDRLWSIWQRKSPTPAYVPLGTGSAKTGHNGSDIMIRFGTPGDFNTTVEQHPVDVLNHQALGSWYPSDLPDITLSTSVINFGNVPEQHTSSTSIQFAVRTSRPITFHITTISGDNFSIPSGQAETSVEQHTDQDIVTANVSIQFQAIGTPNTPQIGSATVEASCIDTDGYDTAHPGDPLVVGTWTVQLSATTIAPTLTPLVALAHHGGHEESMDHEHMHFTMFRRDAQGNILAVDPRDIRRDPGGSGSIGKQEQRDSSSHAQGSPAHSQTAMPESGEHTH